MKFFSNQGGYFHTFIQYGSPSYLNEFTVQVMPSATGLVVQFRGYIGTTTWLTSAGPSLSGNTWYFIVVQWSAASPTISISIDGVEVATPTNPVGSSYTLGGPSGCLVIGAEGTGACDATTGYSAFSYVHQYYAKMSHVRCSCCLFLCELEL
jgi:hypothetical protein